MNELDKAGLEAAALAVTAYLTASPPDGAVTPMRPTSEDVEEVAALIYECRALVNAAEIGPIGRPWINKLCDVVDAQAELITRLAGERDALHHGLRERGMRLESTAPHIDALNALDEWKAKAESAEARAAEVETALAPFAAMAERYDSPIMDGHVQVAWTGHSGLKQVFIRDFRRAAAVLARSREPSNGG
jgi:hypothetical protein